MSKPRSSFDAVAGSPGDVTSRLSFRARTEWIILAVICIIGVGMRLARWDHLAIEHFDEGVYAANLYADLDEYRYPQRHLYAPPLFPLLCELAIGVGGTPDAAIWVNLLFGSLMVPLVWFVARDGFGSVGAIVASTLCATSDYHIFFSRSALTDVSLGFWLLLAVWLAGKGMRSGSGLMLGGAAIAAALAWWTKYNGWLAIAIPLGGWGLSAITEYICQFAFFRRLCPLSSIIGTAIGEDSRVGEGAGGRLLANAPGIDRAGLLRWGLFAVVAALLWSPVVYGLQSVGGYSVVAKNHAGYLVGISGWWHGVQMHIAYHGWLTSPVGVGGLALAEALVVFQQGRRGFDLAPVLFTLLIPAAVLGVGGTLGITAFIAILWSIRGWSLSRPISDTAITNSNSQRLLMAMLVTWWVGLTLTTPLYTPYARLSLPWLVSCWLLFGALLSRLDATRWKVAPRVPRMIPSMLVGVIGAVSFTMLVLLVTGRPQTHFQFHSFGTVPAWSDRTGLRKATGQIVHELDMGRRDMRPSEVAGFDAAVYVVGEPALFCHLSEASQTSEMNLIVKPGANMSVAAPGPPLPTFIITGSHASMTEIDAVIAAGQMELIWEQRVLVSDMVALDSASLPQLQVKRLKSQRGPEYSIPIRIYRVLQ